MKRNRTGNYETTSVGGEKVRAFVPAPLPPVPPIAINGEVRIALDAALLALGRLDGVSSVLPDTHLLLYTYVRKEAVLSSQIEGAQSTLADLLLFEVKESPGVPLDDGPLGAGLQGFKFANAAELLRHTGYDGWTDADIARCERSFLDVWYPAVSGYMLYANGNWDLTAIQTILAIGVFCDEPTLVEDALRFAAAGAGNGSVAHRVVQPDGQGQESGRDQGHEQLAVGLMGDIAQVAWNQGVDLWGFDGNRILALERDLTEIRRVAVHRHRPQDVRQEILAKPVRGLQSRDAAAIDVQLDESGPTADLDLDARLRRDLRPAHVHFGRRAEVPVAQDLGVRFAELDDFQRAGLRRLRRGLSPEQSGTRQNQQQHGD